MQQTRRALVVGLGIAGMSAAIGLRDAGWDVLVVERAPNRRSGGYFVGLFADGKQAAKDLDVLQHLHVRNPDEGTDWQVGSRGSQRPAMGFLDQPGEPFAVMRGDIESALWERLQGDGAGLHGQHPVEIRFGTRPTTLTQDADTVTVAFDDGAAERSVEERFELVVGADGLRSSVRQSVFGPHEEFMRPWNAMICAFELDTQVPGYQPQDGITLALPKRAAWVFPFSDRTPTALLTYRTTNIDAQFARPAGEVLREVYAGLDVPVVQHALRTVEQQTQFLFDSVHSVEMPSWSSGRVVLLGDAAWCLTLYSGMGSTSALRGGAELARALRQHDGDVSAALEAWEEQMRPVIATNLRRARVLQHMFVPSNRMTSLLRDGSLRLIHRLRRAQQARTRRTAPRVRA